MNQGTVKIKKIVARALEIREKAGYTTEIINKKRYNMPYIPDAVKRAAKELKTPGTAPVKRSKRVVKTAGLKKKSTRINFSDPVDVQKIKESIIEGEMIIRAGTFNGKKLSVERLETVKRSVENSKRKLASLRTPGTAPAPAKRTKRIIKTKAFAKRLPRTKPDEINYETAKRAYYAISFDPEKRAVSAQKEFAEELNTFAQELEKVIKTKDQYAVAKAEFERYKAGYKTKYLHWLAAKSRTMSSMITGPAKFPVARNQKYCNYEDTARKELIDYEKYKAKIIDKVKNAATPEMKADERWDSIKKTVLSDISKIIAIKTGKMPGYDVRLFVSSLTGFLRRILKNGQVEHYNKSIDLIEEYENKTGVRVIAPNNPMRNRAVPVVKTEADTETVELYNKNGLQIENNKEDERYRLFFDGKPSQAIINELKSHAWKWSPYNKAWQRKNTPDAHYYLRKFFIPEFIEK